ncbi:MAG TPA: CHAT domain-containing protein [Thermoanaerobaculia bacterium]|nr:CHAT domain-containing protein [Thermoanaerobaculia bacterium]
MRTITLELLRHGPAHNQLLSPLTPYLALCENHAAVTLHVPFEHNQFLHRLSALGYKLSEESRLFQLQDTARVLGGVLSGIPGLTAETNRDNGTEEPLTHLRLIISASELALLPFELALSPDGCPGSGQQLLLQPQLPLCLTREIRRVPGEAMEWPDRPRILFVAAAPPGVGAIPLESHLLALRRVIDPWVRYFDPEDEKKRKERTEKHLELLTGASVEAIEKACASGRYTHVHILAHGVERKEGYDTRFFLALHDSQNANKVDYVSGSRLASALRVARKPDSRGLARPIVVTLASCDSGNVGSVAGAGASIAHSLHEAGIPMVVASQFPLSFPGSVLLVDALYEGLLWGTDPRRLLYDLRRRLHAQSPLTHDWASLTAYMSLPEDFEEQIARVQIERAMDSINAAMNHADEVTRRFFPKLRSKRTESEYQEKTPEEKLELLKSARQKIRDAKKNLERLTVSIPKERPRIYGLLASTEKRQAEVLYSAKESSLIDGKAQESDRRESIDLLLKARDHYWKSFLLKRSSSWAIVQYLSLTLVLKHAQLLKKEEEERPEKDLNALWSLAQLLSLYDLHNQDRDAVLWAHGNLMELYMLSLIMEPAPGRPGFEETVKLALDHTDALIDIAGRDSFEVYSTRRQIFRYVNWFPQIAIQGLEPLLALADQIFAKFSEDVEERWK